MTPKTKAVSIHKNKRASQMYSKIRQGIVKKNRGRDYSISYGKFPFQGHLGDGGSVWLEHVRGNHETQKCKRL
jgi:hypothetical protein